MMELNVGYNYLRIRRMINVIGVELQFVIKTTFHSRLGDLSASSKELH